uniref:Uncharacterized protein n=1 Tax=Lactuca sativa TaxID=4236 RepID=A0A9R1UPK5_LACSA|nr:hypothetical protein LSAT_V11C800440600 [Lactuca sativa]
MGITYIIRIYIFNLVCKLFRDSVTSDALYKIIDTNRLTFRRFIRSHKQMQKVKQHTRTLQRWNEIAGKQLLQDAADYGQLDAIFVLGMMLMAKGIEKKQEALFILNNAYVNTR